MPDACTPRARYTERTEAAKNAARIQREEAEAATAKRIADGERESLEDPDRPKVLRPADWPKQIIVRIVQGETISVETGAYGDLETSTSLGAEAETAEDLWQPDQVMAGAEVAFAALGYTLDRFRMYRDMDLMVGHFYRKAGPYA